MVLAWDYRYEFSDATGRRRQKETRTSQSLIDACTYPVMMAPLIDEGEDEELIDQLFVA